MSKHTRRRFIGSVSTASLMAIAGCSSILGGGEGTPSANAGKTVAGVSLDPVTESQRLDSWIPATWQAPINSELSISYSAVDAEKLREVNIPPARENIDLTRAGISSTSGDTSVRVARVDHEDIGMTILGRGETERLLNELEDLDFEEIETEGSARVFQEPPSEGDNNIMMFTNDTTVYMSGSLETVEALYPKLLSMQNNPSDTWTGQSPESEPIFTHAARLDDLKSVFFAPSNPQPFEGIGDQMLAICTGTKYINENYDQARQDIAIAFAEGTTISLDTVRDIYANNIASADKRRIRMPYWAPMTDPAVGHLDGENTVLISDTVSTNVIRDNQDSRSSQSAPTPSQNQ